MLKRYYRSSTVLSFAALAMMFINVAFITDALMLRDLDVDTAPAIPLIAWVGYFLSLAYAVIAILCTVAAGMQYADIGAPKGRKLSSKRSSALGAGVIISQMFYLVFVGNDVAYEWVLSVLQVAIGLSMMMVPTDKASKAPQSKAT